MSKKSNEPLPLEPVDVGKTIRLPKSQRKELLGIVVAELGGSRMRCICSDGKERIGRIPGRMKRTVWVKESDIVILKPWDIEGDKKGDIIWRYKKFEVKWLRNKGMLNFEEV